MVIQKNKSVENDDDDDDEEEEEELEHHNHIICKIKLIKGLSIFKIIYSLIIILLNNNNNNKFAFIFSVL